MSSLSLAGAPSLFGSKPKPEAKTSTSSALDGILGGPDISEKSKSKKKHKKSSKSKDKSKKSKRKEKKKSSDTNLDAELEKELGIFNESPPKKRESPKNKRSRKTNPSKKNSGGDNDLDALLERELGLGISLDEEDTVNLPSPKIQEKPHIMKQSTAADLLAGDNIDSLFDSVAKKRPSPLSGTGNKSKDKETTESKVSMRPVSKTIPPPPPDNIINNNNNNTKSPTTTNKPTNSTRMSMSSISESKTSPVVKSSNKFAPMKNNNTINNNNSSRNNKNNNNDEEIDDDSLDLSGMTWGDETGDSSLGGLLGESPEKPKEKPLEKPLEKVEKLKVAEKPSSISIGKSSNNGGNVTSGRSTPIEPGSGTLPFARNRSSSQTTVVLDSSLEDSTSGAPFASNSSNRPITALRTAEPKNTEPIPKPAITARPSTASAVPSSQVAKTGLGDRPLTGRRGSRRQSLLDDDLDLPDLNDDDDLFKPKRKVVKDPFAAVAKKPIVEKPAIPSPVIEPKPVTTNTPPIIVAKTNTTSKAPPSVTVKSTTAAPSVKPVSQPVKPPIITLPVTAATSNKTGFGFPKPTPSTVPVVTSNNKPVVQTKGTFGFPISSAAPTVPNVNKNESVSSMTEDESELDFSMDFEESVMTGFEDDFESEMEDTPPSVAAPKSSVTVPTKEQPKPKITIIPSNTSTATNIQRKQPQEPQKKPDSLSAIPHVQVQVQNTVPTASSQVQVPSQIITPSQAQAPSHVSSVPQIQQSQQQQQPSPQQIQVLTHTQPTTSPNFVNNNNNNAANAQLADTIKNLTEDNETLKNNLEQQKDVVKTLENQLIDAKEENSDLERRYRLAKDDALNNSTDRSELNKLKSENDELKRNLEMCRQRLITLEPLEREIADLRSKIGIVEQQKMASDSQIISLKHELTASKTDIERKANLMQDERLNQQAQRFENERNDMKRKMDDIEERCKRQIERALADNNDDNNRWKKREAELKTDREDAEELLRTRHSREINALKEELNKPDHISKIMEEVTTATSMLKSVQERVTAESVQTLEARSQHLVARERIVEEMSDRHRAAEQRAQDEIIRLQALLATVEETSRKQRVQYEQDRARLKEEHARLEGLQLTLQAESETLKTSIGADRKSLTQERQHFDAERKQTMKLIVQDREKLFEQQRKLQLAEEDYREESVRLRRQIQSQETILSEQRQKLQEMKLKTERESTILTEKSAQLDERLEKVRDAELKLESEKTAFHAETRRMTELGQQLKTQSETVSKERETSKIELAKASTLKKEINHMQSEFAHQKDQLSAAARDLSIQKRQFQQRRLETERERGAVVSERQRISKLLQTLRKATLDGPVDATTVHSLQTLFNAPSTGVMSIQDVSPRQRHGSGIPHSTSARPNSSGGIPGGIGSSTRPRLSIDPQRSFNRHPIPSPIVPTTSFDLTNTTAMHTSMTSAFGSTVEPSSSHSSMNSNTFLKNTNSTIDTSNISNHESSFQSNHQQLNPSSNSFDSQHIERPASRYSAGAAPIRLNRSSSDPPRQQPLGRTQSFRFASANDQLLDNWDNQKLESQRIFSEQAKFLS